MTVPDTHLDLEALVEDGKIDTVIAVFPDHIGRLMGKRLRAEFFLEAVCDKVMHACNYLLTADLELEPLPGFSLASWDQGYGDFAMRPDPSTLRLVPWSPGSALVICDLLHEDGSPVEESPRQILKRQIEACAELGLTPMMASELELYLFKGTAETLAEGGFRDLVPTTPYLIDYHILGTQRDEPYLREVRAAMAQARIEVEGSKGEWGKGQHEINLRYCDALEMADRHVVFKEGAKILARQYGLSASFMAKVNHAMAGSSCHIHTSLVNRNGRNVFWDEATEGASDTFRHFLAGCLKHARDVTLLYAPNVNSYKRYQASSFAPKNLAWADDNRTCGFRVIGGGSSYRIENRIPGADVNPYLAFAATLASGLDGLSQELELQPPASGNAYQDVVTEQVPTTLIRATEAFAASSFAREAFGPKVASHYARLARREQAIFDATVTDLEVSRYFERI